MFSDAKKTIDVRSVAWMYNRILETLSHSGPLAIVHGGIHPENILLHPESHRIVVTGWSSSVKVSEKIMYANDVYTFMYPEEVVGVKDKRKAFLSSDLYMAACTVWHVLGGDVLKKTLPRNIPNEIRAFLDARLTSDLRLRDSVAIQQRDRFSGVLKGLYGPAKFHTFVLPISRR
jgi:serine/threonine protein kinase